MTPTESQAHAVACVRKVATLIEAAQHQAEDAAAKMSGIVGACREWERICKLCERLHIEWDRLDALARRPGRIRLDVIAEEGVEREQERERGKARDEAWQDTTG